MPLTDQKILGSVFDFRLVMLIGAIYLLGMAFSLFILSRRRETLRQIRGNRVEYVDSRTRGAQLPSSFTRVVAGVMIMIGAMFFSIFFLIMLSLGVTFLTSLLLAGVIALIAALALVGPPSVSYLLYSRVIFHSHD